MNYIIGSDSLVAIGLFRLDDSGHGGGPERGKDDGFRRRHRHGADD